MSGSLFSPRKDLSALAVAVLTALADAVGDGVLEEGEIKAVLGRSWSLLPTLRALWRRDLVGRAHYWSWQITDAGLEAIGRRPRKPTLTVIAGGVSG